MGHDFSSINSESQSSSKIHGPVFTLRDQSMAEAAGLVVGTIALASLFQTCLDFLEYIEDARNIKCDRQRGETKIGLLKMRLKQWGGNLQVTNPGHEHGGLRKHWPEENRTIKDCLVGIAGILKDASALIYGRQPPKKPPASMQLGRDLYGDDYKGSEIFELPQNASTSFATFKQRILWALKDKRKLDSLIQELEFFVTNLEKVTKRVTKSIIPVSPAFSQSSDNDSNVNMNSNVRTLQDLRPDQRTKGPGRVLGSNSSDEQKSPEGSKGDTYNNNKASKNSQQFMGNFGQVSDKLKSNEYKGQEATDKSSQYMGNYSEKVSAQVLPSSNGDSKDRQP